MTSLMRAKTRAEPEVIYYLLQVQERAFGEGCIELRYDVYTYVHSTTCTVLYAFSGVALMVGMIECSPNLSNQWPTLLRLKHKQAACF